MKIGAQKPLALLAVLGLAMLVAASALASSERITVGDARAVFEAANTGGAAIRLRGGQDVGPALVGAADGVRINGTPPWEGRHYCVLDWHVIAVNLIDGNFPGESRTPREIATSLETVHVEYFLDGAPLEVRRTPVKRAVDPTAVGLVEAYYFTAGRLMAPEDIAVGQHTLRLLVTVPEGVFSDTQITFHVDAPGTGACL